VNLFLYITDTRRHSNRCFGGLVLFRYQLRKYCSVSVLLSYLKILFLIALLKRSATKAFRSELSLTRLGGAVAFFIMLNSGLSGPGSVLRQNTHRALSTKVYK